MPFPNLSQFLVYPPGFTPETSIDRVRNELSHDGALYYSHIIILDAFQRPTGALAISRLWQSTFATDGRITLGHFNQWIEPILQVSATQALSAVWPLPPADSAPPMVIVDDTMRYVGIVNPLAVLTWLSREIRIETNHLNAKDSPQANSQEPAASPQNWLLEVSHALKNPLTSLLGLSTLLLDQRIGSLNNRQTRYATLIQQVVRKLISLVNQLLDWMRLENDQLSFELEDINTEPFLRQVVNSYLAQLSDSPSPWADNFDLDLPSDPLTIQADPLRLKLSLHWILDYLLLHQAEPAGIEAALWGPWAGLTLWTLAPAIVSLESLEEGRKLTSIEGQDNQPGTLENLGLLLSQRFCQRQGGDLTYRASRGGNRITLLLPLASERNAGDRKPHIEASSVLLLLVCYSPDVMDQVCLQLQGSDYRLAVARSLRAAEGMIQRLGPSFVLVCPRSFPEGPAMLAGVRSTSNHTSLVLQLLTKSTTPQAVVSPAVPEVTLATLKPTLDQLRETATVPSPTAMPSFTLLLLPLSAAQPGAEDGFRLTSELRSWLQHYHCRLLQVDDLAQAQVLSRVWQPDAIVIDSSAPIYSASWRTLAQLPELARLPFITLHENRSQPSASDYGLTVLHCPALEHRPQWGATMLIHTIETAVNGRFFE